MALIDEGDEGKLIEQILVVEQTASRPDLTADESLVAAAERYNEETKRLKRKDVVLEQSREKKKEEKNKKKRKLVLAKDDVTKSIV